MRHRLGCPGGFPISAADGTVYCEECGGVIGKEEPLPRAPWWQRLWYWAKDRWFEIRHPDCPF